MLPSITVHLIAAELVRKVAQFTQPWLNKLSTAILMTPSNHRTYRVHGLLDWRIFRRSKYSYRRITRGFACLRCPESKTQKTRLSRAEPCFTLINNYQNIGVWAVEVYFLLSSPLPAMINAVEIREVKQTFTTRQLSWSINLCYLYLIKRKVVGRGPIWVKTGKALSGFRFVFLENCATAHWSRTRKILLF